MMTEVRLMAYALQYRVIMARNFAMANDDGPENKASRAAKDGFVEMSNEHIEALRLWSAGQANIPRRRRIMVCDLGTKDKI